jgi:hypothetical protein
MTARARDRRHPFARIAAWALGRTRMGNARVDTDHIWVIGDRHDFLNSEYGKLKGEEGYVRKI